MHSTLMEIEKIGIVPVIKIDDAAKAVPLANALKKGGIPCAEVTFRTAEGEAAIRNIAKEVSGVLLGAGTVLTTEQVDRAIDAGASFIVSPGFNPTVVEYCVKKNMLITPGCSTPSDMEKAMEYGLDVVKFFPAEQAGGLEFLKAVAAPYTKLRFMPTGGINTGNLLSYLAFDKIVACGGSWMVKPEMINSGDFDGIEALCRKAVREMLGFELKHIGVNAENEAEALGIAKAFEALFGFEVKAGNSSLFAGTAVEVMKTPYLGRNGHIAIGVNSVLRTRASLERQGFTFLDETAKPNSMGKVNAIYLKDEIGGFAVHLLQK